MRKIRDVSPSERLQILQDYKNMIAKDVGKKYGLTEDQVRGLGYRTGIIKPRGNKPSQKKPDTPLEKKIYGMLNRTYVYNCQFRTIKGYDVGDNEVKLLTDSKPITLPIKKAIAILDKQFLSMTQ